MTDDDPQRPQIRGASFASAPAEPSPAPPSRRSWVVPAVVAVVATVVAGVVVTSVSGSGQASEADDATSAATTRFELPADRRARLVTELIARRTSALRAGDEAAWLADIDPAATAATTLERMRFANLRQLRLGSFNLISRGFGTDFYALRSDDGTATVHIRQVMQLQEDVVRSSSLADWTLRFDRDHVRITAITPGSDRDSLGNAPWDDMPLRSARGAAVTVFAPAAGKWDPKTYLPAAERAAKLVRSLWGKRLGIPGFVVFLADKQHFGTWFDNGADRSGASGVTVFPPMVEADGAWRMARPNPTVIHKDNVPSWIQRSAGSRIVLDMAGIGSVRLAERVIAHEMAHAMGPHLIQATRVDFGPKGTSNQAIWPIEGFARWVEFADDPAYGPAAMAAVRSARAKYRPSGPFPASDGFYASDSGRTSYNYNLSSSLFLAAARVGGRQKAVDLYICLTNQMEYQADTELFINVCVKGVGLNPARIWPLQHRLTT